MRERLGGRVVLTLLVIDLLVLAGGVWRAGSLPTQEERLRQALRREVTADWRREEATLKKDPVLEAQVAGTTLRSGSSVPAGRDPWNALQSTQIRRLYDIRGEPGRLVEAYRAPAEAAGWRFLEVRCSPRFGSTSMRFVKEFDGFSATLQLYGHLERPYPESGRRGLLLLLRGVMYDHNNPPVPANPESASLRRRDVHCLEKLNPSDPGLHPPGTVPATGEQVCSLLPLRAARAVVPSVTTVEADGSDAVACRYGLPRGRLGFSVLAAPDPRSWYEDDQWAPAVAGGKAFLMEGSRGVPPRSAWVESRAGPVQIVDNGASDNSVVGPDGLLALAQRMATADRPSRPGAE